MADKDNRGEEGCWIMGNFVSGRQPYRSRIMYEELHICCLLWTARTQQVWNSCYNMKKSPQEEDPPLAHISEEFTEEDRIFMYSTRPFMYEGRGGLGAAGREGAGARLDLLWSSHSRRARQDLQEEETCASMGSPRRTESF